MLLHPVIIFCAHTLCSCGHSNCRSRTNKSFSVNSRHLKDVGGQFRQIHHNNCGLTNACNIADLLLAIIVLLRDIGKRIVGYLASPLCTADGVPSKCNRKGFHIRSMQ